MSFDGHVLCQRMLIGPCALTTLGAAMVAAPAASAPVFRNLRRETLVADLSLIVSSCFLRFNGVLVRLVYHGLTGARNGEVWRIHHLGDPAVKAQRAASHWIEHSHNLETSSRAGLFRSPPSLRSAIAVSRRPRTPRRGSCGWRGGPRSPPAPAPRPAGRR